jgi:NUMOD4 motif/HNH endonuclease
MNAAETWRPVMGYEGLYEVSDLGRVRSLDRMTGRRLRRGRILKAIPQKRGGHLHVSLCADGTEVVRHVHRIVLEAFVGPRPDGMETRHLDGDPVNNALTNICWGTYADNRQDMLRHGKHPNSRKTHCPRGHEYTPENTYRSSARGGRGCRECRKLRQQIGGTT